MYFADLLPNRLLRLLRKERATMRSLMALGLSRLQAFELLTHPAVGEAQSEAGVLDGLFDASDREEDGGVIMWWNDLEKDNRSVERMSLRHTDNILTIYCLAAMPAGEAL